jgi:hypothetical protein
LLDTLGMKQPRLLFFAFAALAACGGATTSPQGDDDGDDDDDPVDRPDAAPSSRSVEYADLIPELAEVYCGRVFACCDMEERKLIGIIPYTDMRPEIPDAAACTTYMSTFLASQSYVAQVKSAVESGELQYDAAKAGACLDQFAAMTCDAFGHDFDGVRNMRECPPFAVNKAMGDKCSFDDQCPSDYCASPDAGGDLICRDKPVANAQCPVGECADGLFCGFDDGICHPILANGAECTFDQDCQSKYCSYDNSTGDKGYCSIAETWVCDGE